jgi:hypothetical protein
MSNRSRTVLAGIGATAALAWAPLAIAQALVAAPAPPAAATKVILVEPSEHALRSTGMSSKTEMRAADPSAGAPATPVVVATEKEATTAPGSAVVGERTVVAERGALDAAGYASGHIQSQVARVEPLPQGNGLTGVTPLRLADGSRVVVPWPMSATGRPGERVNVDYTTTDTGERIATRFMFESTDEAP